MATFQEVTDKEKLKGVGWELLKGFRKAKPSEEVLEKLESEGLSSSQRLNIVKKRAEKFDDQDDPNSAYWLMFELFYDLDGLEVAEKSIKHPECGTVTRNEMLYIFARYVAAPPSMEFFEAMFDGWTQLLQKRQEEDQRKQLQQNT